MEVVQADGGVKRIGVSECVRERMRECVREGRSKRQQSMLCHKC